MKLCSKCGDTKDLFDFYKHPGMADGLLNKCKVCTRKDAIRNRKASIEKYRCYDRERGNRQSLASLKAYRDKYPIKYKAHCAVNNAVRDGKLVRGSCEICGSVNGVHAHHDDYSQALEVRWLCPAHHSEWHVINGEAKNAS